MALIEAIDVSNYTGDLGALLAAYPNTRLLIVRLSTETGAKRAKAVDQLRWGKARGLALAGYHWLYWADPDPMGSAKAALTIIAEAGVRACFVALDAEDNTDAATVGPVRMCNAILNAAGRVRSWGIEPILYTRKTWLDQFIPDARRLTGLRLWLAGYGEPADLTSVALPRGWKREQVIGHQYAENPDLNVFQADILPA